MGSVELWNYGKKLILDEYHVDLNSYVNDKLSQHNADVSTHACTVCLFKV